MASISKTTFTWVYEMGRLEQETEEGRGTVMLSRQAINILLRAYRERGMWARKGGSESLFAVKFSLCYSRKDEEVCAV